MKLKFYMRGLGIGILVTAVLMSVTIHGKTEKLTDEEIIERAKELGMEEKYDSKLLSEGADISEKADMAEDSFEAGAGGLLEYSDSGERVGVSENDLSETESSETEPTEAEPAETPPADSGEAKGNAVRTVQITVQGGDGSMTVSRKLEEAGLIDDVLAYDKFLCSTGYDKRICTGTHSIPVDATEEEIARILITKPD